MSTFSSSRVANTTGGRDATNSIITTKSRLFVRIIHTILAKPKTTSCFRLFSESESLLINAFLVYAILRKLGVQSKHINVMSNLAEKAWPENIVYDVRVCSHSLQVGSEHLVDLALSRLMIEVSTQNCYPTNDLIQELFRTIVVNDDVLFDADIVHHRATYSAAFLQAFLRLMQRGSALWNILQKPFSEEYQDVRSILRHKQAWPFPYPAKILMEEMLVFEADPSTWITSNLQVIYDQEIARTLATTFDAKYFDENKVSYACKFVDVGLLDINERALNDVYASLMRGESQRRPQFVVFIITKNVDVYRGYANVLIRSANPTLPTEIRDHMERLYRANPYRSFVPLRVALNAEYTNYMRARIYVDRFHIEGCFERVSPPTV